MIEQWKKIQRSLLGIAEPSSSEGEESAITDEIQQFWNAWDNF